jgi:hypothetical protein
VKKKIFAYLLLTIISFQILPLKEVGAIFYGNQMVEEICNAAADADGKSTEGNEDIKKSDLFFTGSSITLLINFESKGSCVADQKDYASRLSDDIPTPPPLSIS